MADPIPKFFPQIVREEIVRLQKMPREEACATAAAIVGSALSQLGVLALTTGDKAGAVGFVAMSYMLARFCAEPFVPGMAAAEARPEVTH